MSWNARTSFSPSGVTFQNTYQGRDYKTYSIRIYGRVFQAMENNNLILQTTLWYIQSFERATFDDLPGVASLLVFTTDGRARTIIDKVDDYRVQEALTQLYNRMDQFWNEGT